LFRAGLQEIDLLIDEWTNLGASDGNRADGFACADQRDGQGCAERRAQCCSGHFADQAVIAIEIAQRFEAERVSKRELEQLPQYRRQPRRYIGNFQVTKSAAAGARCH